MTLEVLDTPLSICRLNDVAALSADAVPCFFARTDEELSLVCPTACVPERAVKRSDGWRALRVKGPLDFGLVGVLARLSGLLADGGISLFAISTYDTDYLLLREPDLAGALDIFASAGYDIAR